MTAPIRPEQLQDSIVDLAIDAREWEAERVQVLDREAVSTTWADDIQGSDDEGCYLAGLFAAELTPMIDDLIRYAQAVIERAQDEDAWDEDHEPIAEHAERVLNGMLKLTEVTA